MGAIGSYAFHPAFIWLSAFVGAGLVFAGITDTCGMGMLLARMPWNQCDTGKDSCCCSVGWDKRASASAGPPLLLSSSILVGRRMRPLAGAPDLVPPYILQNGVLIMKLVIVGGVAGGASAAARARRLSEDAQIVLFERGPEVSFANCGLPYYVGGSIAQREKLLVTTAERLHERFNLDVRTRSSVEAIDRAAKKVRVRDLASGREYEESYDKLILAPGAAPVRPPIPGIDLPGIYTLRNLQDVDQIKARIDQGVKQAVVVGAGFIGLELVENFVRRGIATTLVELQDQVLPPLDKEMTTPIVADARRQGRDRAALPVGRGFRANRRWGWSCG